MTGDANETGIRDLGFARIDVDREARTGDPEVVYGAGKTPTQVAEILRTLHDTHPDRAVLATRLTGEALDLVVAELPDCVVDPVARAVTLGPMPTARGTVAVVSAGTSDAPVAADIAAMPAGTGAVTADVSAESADWAATPVAVGSGRA